MPVCLPLFGILVHVRLTSKERNRIRNCRKYHQYTDNDYAGLPPSVRHPRTRQINLKGKKQDPQLQEIPPVYKQRLCRSASLCSASSYTGRGSATVGNPVIVQRTVWPVGMPLLGIIIQVRLKSRQRSRVSNCRKSRQCPDYGLAGQLSN
ncbi:hypothetical protein J6590_069978 [Homalodisca vitripennis]|nr:hypothetical protein J6590_069978 [Homalodisca vitripennis]